MQLSSPKPNMEIHRSINKKFFQKQKKQEDTDKLYTYTNKKAKPVPSPIKTIKK